MPGSFTTDLTLVSNCDVTTNWTIFAGTNGTTPSQAINEGNKVEGVAALNMSLPTSVTVFPAIEGQRLPGTWNFSGADMHFWSWHLLLQPTILSTRAVGGLRIYMQSDTTWAYPATNYREWNLDGSDRNVTGGWRPYCLNPNANAPTGFGRQGGTLATTAIKFIAKILSLKSYLNTNAICYHDAWRYGSTVTITQGTNVAPVTLNDLFLVDSSTTNAWGFVTYMNDIAYGHGKFQFGTASQTAVTVFKDKSLVLVWPNDPVSATFNAFNLLGSASFPTTVQLGDFSGGITSNGCTIRGSGVTSGTDHSCWNITVGANSVFKAYNPTFSELRRATLTASCEIRDAVFSNFGDITPNGAVITDSLFFGVKTTAPINGTTALQVSSPSEINNITNCRFISCTRAIRITAPGTYTFDNLKFSNNTYDIENSSSGLVTINCSNGSNPATFINTGGGSVVINNTIVLKLTGIKTSGPTKATGSEVRVLDRTTQTELAGIENCTTGEFEYSYSYVPGTYVDIVVFHEEYLAYRLDNYLLGSVNGSIPIQQAIDRQYSNMA